MPAEVGEAGEVTVVGVDGAAMFEGDGSNGGVSELRAGYADIGAELLKEQPVAGAGVEDTDVREGEPGVDGCRCVSEGDGGMSSEVCLDTHEGEDGDGGKDDGLAA